MKINLLTWDSHFFNKIIGEVYLEQPTSLEHPENYDVIVVKQTKSFSTNIPHFKLTFQETKVLFEKKLTTKNDIDFSDIQDTDHRPKTTDELTDLALLSGNYSRFLLDKNFGSTNFENLYREWVTNSLNKKFAVKVFYIEEDNKPTAFVTLQKDKQKGKIGLIATDKNHQGKGLGKKLLHHVENFCLENNMESLEIPTQKENEQACKFYEKMGYILKEELIITHFWKDGL